jgi:iron-sulfur cluster repair protein YtfE (RIC family)
MCFYCGCRDIPLIRDFIAEHERVTDLGSELTGALERGELDRAREILGEVSEQLESHWQGEEDGLFTAMAGEETYREYIDALVAEHGELRDLLASANLEQAADRERVVAAMEELYEHIAKEEDGLFPASLTALSGDDWDRAIRAWELAHEVRLRAGPVTG